jgi:hypothetical protein
MNRIDSPWGRLYATPAGLAPSVTTVLKATDPKPFSLARWRDSIVRKGISAADAERYTPAFAARHGLGDDASAAALALWVEQPLPYNLHEAQAEAEAFTAWKSEHSSRRGDALHAHLEELLPAGAALTWGESAPPADDPTTSALLASLWSGEVLSDIAEVLSVEQRLWYWSSGLGYAGSEDICYRSHRHGLLCGDWKTKDPKPYCPSKYGSDYKLQLVAYAGARTARLGTQLDGLVINYCFTDGSPAVQTVVERQELAALWLQWQARLKAWWATIGPELARWNP